MSTITVTEEMSRLSCLLVNEVMFSVIGIQDDVQDGRRLAMLFSVILSIVH